MREWLKLYLFILAADVVLFALVMLIAPDGIVALVPLTAVIIFAVIRLDRWPLKRERL